jgi:hypothetical protein
MRILTLFARHGTSKYPDALGELLAFYRRCLPSVRRELLVIDNDFGSTGGPEGHPVIAGSNNIWEFSAWDEGLAHVGDAVHDFDFVHLVTSAFRTLYTRYIDRIDESLLERTRGRAVAIGHVDYYNEPVEICSTQTQSWLRSSFVFVPPTELKLMGRLGYVSDGSRFFSDDPQRPFRAGAPCSKNYQKYVLDWLTGPGTGQGVTWHSRFIINLETLPYFKAKALAMLNEQLLSIRLRRQGCAIVDATWLATYVTRVGRTALLGPIPNWRCQLAERDSDAVRLPSLVAE